MHIPSLPSYHTFNTRDLWGFVQLECPFLQKVGSWSHLASRKNWHSSWQFDGRKNSIPPDPPLEGVSVTSAHFASSSLNFDFHHAYPYIFWKLASRRTLLTRFLIFFVIFWKSWTQNHLMTLFRQLHLRIVSRQILSLGRDIYRVSCCKLNLQHLIRSMSRFKMIIFREKPKYCNRA